MNINTLGIIGGGQLGSMLASAAKKIGIKTIIFCEDINSPAQNFPYETLKKINDLKKVLPDPKINKIIQNRLTEKDFVNELNIRTTSYVSIKNDKDLKSNTQLIPGIIKTCTLGYDGKGQFKINSIEDLNSLNLDFEQDYILEKFINLKQSIS